SDGRNLFSGVFQLAAGSNSLTLSAGNLLIDWIQFNSVISGITERPGIPNEFSLSQNYPNPFNPTTNINFSISKPSMVKLFIYDILGRKVATLINNEMNTGSYVYNFDASRFASGVYFYSLEAGDFKVTKKMMLLK
ncbi:MAG: T9SS type A sorting domain-containing protein, partial [Ignavibacteria bacterium]